MKSKKAFTLIELLVVIAVIALLLGMLLPALRSAKNQARKVICKAHLHSIGQLLAVYALDYDDKLTPDWWSFPYVASRRLDATLGDVMWHYLTQEYWENPDILFCPSAKKRAYLDGRPPHSSDSHPDEWGHTYWAWYTPWAPPLRATDESCTSSYGVNDFACTPYRLDPKQQEADDKVFWGKLNQKNPERIPVVFDSAWYSVMPSDSDGPPALADDKCHMDGGSFDPMALPRHKNDINMLTMDFSVNQVRIKSLWGYKWNRTFDTGNTFTRDGYKWPDWIEKLGR